MPALKVALLVLALGGAVRADEAGPVGRLLVRGEELLVAGSAGGPAERRLAGSPALVIGRARASGKEWLRLLGPDGRAGFVAGPVAPGPLAGARAGEVSSLSPDRDDFPDAAESRQLPADLAARVVGASSRGAPPTLDKLMLPELDNPFLAPWLELEAGAVRGFQAPASLTLAWESGGPDEFSGLVRAPFLAAASRLTEPLRPSPEQALWAAADLGEPPVRRARAGAFGAAEALIELRPAGAGPQRLVLFGSSAGGEERIFALQDSEGTRRLIAVGSYAPFLRAHRSVDLDGDGRAELLLELVQVYGDGTLSSLWLLDGRAGDGAPGLTALPLGGAGGEPGGSVVDSAWGTCGDELWVVRTRETGAGGRALRVASGRYRNGVLQTGVGGVHAAVLGRSASAAGARAAAFAADEGRCALVLRSAEPAGPRAFWAVRLFHTRAEAAREKRPLVRLRREPLRPE